MLWGWCASRTQTLAGGKGFRTARSTRTWKARGTNSIAIQLSGLRLPELQVSSKGSNPFPYLITPEQMEDDARSVREGLLAIPDAERRRVADGGEFSEGDYAGDVREGECFW